LIDNSIINSNVAFMIIMYVNCIFYNRTIFSNTYAVVDNYRYSLLLLKMIDEIQYVLHLHYFLSYFSWYLNWIIQLQFYTIWKTLLIILKLYFVKIKFVWNILIYALHHHFPTNIALMKGSFILNNYNLLYLGILLPKLNKY